MLRVRDGATIGAEAVPHWSHPESGEVGAEALASAVERTADRPDPAELRREFEAAWTELAATIFSALTV